MAEQINVEVVYGTPENQSIVAVKVISNATVENAILESLIIAKYPEIDLGINKVGVWNKSAKLTDNLRDGDRIEIYRPLIADPKEVRKRRAEKAKQEGRADKVTGGRPDKRRNSRASTPSI